MPKVVDLSNGERVTFRPYFNHKADRVFTETMRQGVTTERDEGGNVRVKDIPLANFDRACEAILPLLIDKVEKANDPSFPSHAATQLWLDELLPKDYDVLYQTLLAIKKEVDDAAQEGKKRIEMLETGLETTIGPRLVPVEYVDFQICRELGLTPQELEDMDEVTYRLWLGFMQAEGHATEMRNKKDEFFRS